MSERATLGMSAPAPGTLLAGRYALGEPIASGGSSVVHRAEDRVLQRAVAVKVARHPLTSALGKRVAHEARILASLAHPNLPVMYDAGKRDGFAYLVMELIEGPTFADLASPTGAQSVEHGLRWAAQASRALGYLHESGVVHGDVKPQNLVVSPQGQVKLVDLGLARTAATAAQASRCVSGTPRYLAPEVAAGAEATTASDLYSFGVALYRLFTGRLPFEAGDSAELALQHHAATPVPASSLRAELPQALDVLLLRLLEKEPYLRQPEAQALSQHLEALVAAIEG